MGMLTGKEILLLDLYSFQRWPDVRAAFDRFGSYTPSWSAARRQAVADDGDTDWWNAISPAYRWMMGENGAQGHAVSESGCGAVVGVGALGRFERRGAYASRPTVFGFPQPV